MSGSVFPLVAERYAELGFAVFPCDGKNPKTSNGFHAATTEKRALQAWAEKWPAANVGIATGSVSGIWILDLDADSAEAWLAELEKKHGKLPPTPEVKTRKGRHIYFRLPEGKDIRNSASKVGPKVDVRGNGGYVIAPPSHHPDGGTYKWHNELRPSKLGFAYAPDWLLSIVETKPRAAAARPTVIKPEVPGADRYVRRVLDDEYRALASAGEGTRNHQLFKSTAAMANYIGQGNCTKGMVHDLAVAGAQACGLWGEDGADACLATIESALKQGLANPKQVPEAKPREQAQPPAAKKERKAAAPVVPPLAELAKAYPTVNHAIDDFNKEFAVIHEGSKVGIMREVIHENDSREITIINEKGFETLTANRTLTIDNKEIAISKLWLKAPQRRQFDGRDFRPDGKCPPSIFNLWRGFSYEPKKDAGKFDIFMDHVHTNICKGNKEHTHWLMSWIADLFQNPQRKNGTAVVIKGGMGTGKGAFASHVGRMVSRHYMTTSQASQITGKFNGHMADKLLMFIDEGFWAGDKAAEGTLKSIITEENVTVEYKGKDAIKMKSYVRFIIASNEKWVVPAGLDERRFAVFDIADNAKNNFEYFAEMQQQLTDGGYEALLYYLLNYDYNPNIVRTIPKTDGLLEQKMASMSFELKWWMECLEEGRLRGDNWPAALLKDDFHKAYLDWCDNLNIHRRCDKRQLCAALRERSGVSLEEGRWAAGYTYKLPPLDEARAKFEEAIGHPMKWSQGQNLQLTFDEE